MKINDLGSAKRVKVDKENSTIVSGSGKKSDISARCDQIKQQVEETTSDYDKEKLISSAKKVKDSDEIAQVGTISSNGDKEIGNMIAKAMQKVGNEGVITVEEAKSIETELDVVEGMQFDRGYLSPYFVTNAE